VIKELVALTGDPARVLSTADFSAPEHGAQVSGGGGDRGAALAEAARLFEAGKLTIPVANAFGLHEADQAHTVCERGHVAGRTIIVISDGENHEDDAITAAREAAAAGITVNTVGMGSPGGAPLPLRAGHPETGFRKDKEGNTVMSKLNEQMLQEVAAVGNGAYVRATAQYTGIQQLVDELRTMDQADLGTVRYTGHEDHYQWFLAIGCVLIFVALVSGERTFNVPSISIIQ